MFNPDFYSTKAITVHAMIGSHSLAGKVILEPHGGSGKMIDVLKEYDPKQVIACENYTELMIITQSKADRFLKSDFFDVTPEDISHIDYIIANPPFSKDVEHILHMWEVCPEGCTILTLCNINTIELRSSTKREQLWDIIEKNGEYMNFGSCFDTAERATNVEVAFITLNKPKLEGDREWDGYFDMTEESWPDGEGVIKYNSIQEIVNRVVSSVKLFDETIAATNKIESMQGPIGRNLYFGAYQMDDRRDYIRIDRETYKKELQKSAWYNVFAQMNMDKYVTRSVKEELNKFVEQQTHIPFTMKNVFKMFEVIVGTHDNRMDGILVEAFNKICGFAPGNNTAGETWKTNSNYKVNKKFICDWMCENNNRWPNEYVDLHYSAGEAFDDIQKAFCYLTGIDFDKTTSLRNFVSYGGPKGMRWMQWGQWYEWGFFEIKGYKKGTMHFKFTDDKVWELFNRRVGEIKGWQIPQKTDRKTKGTERQRETMPEVFQV